MSKFVTGEELTHVAYSILFEAKQRLFLVSPYIKLDNYFRRILDQHVHNPQLEILVVYGSNNSTRVIQLKGIVSAPESLFLLNQADHIAERRPRLGRHSVMKTTRKSIITKLTARRTDALL